MEPDLKKITQNIDYLENIPDELRHLVGDEDSNKLALLNIARALVALCDRLDRLTGGLGQDPKAATRALVVATFPQGRKP